MHRGQSISLTDRYRYFYWGQSPYSTPRGQSIYSCLAKKNPPAEDTSRGKKSYGLVILLSKDRHRLHAIAGAHVNIVISSLIDRYRGPEALVQ